MSGAKNKSISLYDQHNSDLRRKIVDNTSLRGENEIQKPALFKPVNLDLMREGKSSESRQFTDRNMKFKLDQLELNLEELLNDVRGARQEGRELVELTALLKQNFIYEDLYGKKAELDKKIQGFSNHIRAIRASSESRFGQIYGECKELWGRTEELRENVFNIRMRVEQLEEKMGFREMYRLHGRDV